MAVGTKEGRERLLTLAAGRDASASSRGWPTCALGSSTADQVRAPQVRFMVEAVLQHGPEPRARGVRHRARGGERAVRRAGRRQHVIAPAEERRRARRPAALLRARAHVPPPTRARSSPRATRRWRPGCSSSRRSARIRMSSGCWKASRSSRRACIAALDDDLPEVSEAHAGRAASAARAAASRRSRSSSWSSTRSWASCQRASTSRAAASCARAPVQGMPCRFRTLLRHDALADDGGGCRVDVGRPRRRRRAVGRSRRRDPRGAARVRGHAAGADRSAASGRRQRRAASPRDALDALRLHLAGDASVADALYELLLNSCARVVVRDPDQPSRAPVMLAGHARHAGGLRAGRGAAAVSAPRRSPGSRCCRSCSRFRRSSCSSTSRAVADALRALGAGAASGAVVRHRAVRARRAAADARARAVDARTFRLGCTPVVNLFEQVAEPILLTERSPSTRSCPTCAAGSRSRRGRWTRVVGDHAGRRRAACAIEPLYALPPRPRRRRGRVLARRAARQRVAHRPRHRGVHLASPTCRAQSARPTPRWRRSTLTCFNGDLPSRLPFGVDERGDFELAQGGPVRRMLLPRASRRRSCSRRSASRCCGGSSRRCRSTTCRWSRRGAEALRELLRLHNVGDSTGGERQIQGLVGVRSAPAYARVAGPSRASRSRAAAASRWSSTRSSSRAAGSYLFASVLERFLALYASMNSFTQLARTLAPAEARRCASGRRGPDGGRWC